MLYNIELASYTLIILFVLRHIRKEYVLVVDVH